MAKGATIAVIVVAVIVVLILVGIGVWLLVRGSGGGGGGPSCTSDSQCTAPLVCDAASQQCRKPRGETCSSDTECISSTACSGGVCRSRYGEACFLDSSCASPGRCQSGRCTTTSASCTDASQCVMPGLDQGRVTCSDGACALVNGQECRETRDCAQDSVCDTSVSPPRCRLAQGQACDSSEDCIESETCLGKRCGPRTCEDAEDCQEPLGDEEWGCVDDGQGTGRCTRWPLPCGLVECDDRGGSSACNGGLCSYSTGSLCYSDYECQSGRCDQSGDSGVCVE